MTARIDLGDIAVDVVFKDIKNVHLSVYPPDGKVRIAAPARMNLERIRVFAVSKLRWIRQQQEKLRAQERETPRDYVDRESHSVWGKRYLLSIQTQAQTPSVALEHNRLILRVRAGADQAANEAMLAQWYREQLKTAATVLIAKWEPIIGVRVNRLFVQQMKTRWGSCNPRAGNIRLNTELAKKPKECLEYIVVHELIHLLEPTHNGRFVGLMDQFLPQWSFYRQRLNRLPVRHADWSY
jgi:predicted metal-dependent hydrolase